MSTTIRLTFERLTRQEAMDLAQNLSIEAEHLTGEAPWWAVQNGEGA